MTLLEKINNLTWFNEIVKLKDILKTMALSILQDAPKDGKQYGREDGTWTEVTSSGGGNQTLQEVTSALVDADGYAETTDGIKTIDLKAGGFGAGDLYYGFGYSDNNDGFKDLYYIPFSGLTHNSQVFPKTASFAYDGIGIRDTSTKKGTSIISDGLNFEDSNTGKYILLKSPTSIDGTDKEIEVRDLAGTMALLSDIPTGATGSFISADTKTVTVVNGIITAIT